MLDIFATVSYQENINKLALIVYEESLKSEFFDLKTRWAGELLQKFSNYNVKLSIVGSFEKYNSKSLQDFIRESNRGNHISFISNVDEAKKS